MKENNEIKSSAHSLELLKRKCKTLIRVLHLRFFFYVYELFP